ncbi:MAG: hypothetical protein V4524_01630 [Patescibacteria group bacterium]
MRQFTSEEIQAKFEQLPKGVQDAITSTDVHDGLIAISKKYNLMLDQEGELVDQVGLIMLGLSPSSSFVGNFANSAGVPVKTATALADDINKDIFSKIKTLMRSTQENIEKASNASSVSDLEHAGDFTVEPEQGSNGIDQTAQPIESHDELIAGIENPVTMVDHLLAGPMVSIEKKSEQKTTSPQKAPPIMPKKPRGPDLYREPVA